MGREKKRVIVFTGQPRIRPRHLRGGDNRPRKKKGELPPGQKKEGID